jgi:solute carrier family 25 S-adenosylmethionine transporter 26
MSTFSLGSFLILFFLLLLLFTVSSASSLAKQLPNRRRFLPKQTITTTTTTFHWLECIQLGISGGIAGAVATGILYPFDAAKTLRQAAPNVYDTVPVALYHLFQTQSLYSGAIPSILGAIPSSAFYFGAYETAKRFLQPRIFTYTMLNQNQNHNNNHNSMALRRWILHIGAAATGNIVSSAIFVPKELIKQRLQYQTATAIGNHHVHHQLPNIQTVIVDILREQGILGLYRGYAATLLRNIPSAALRFGLYEELQRASSSSKNYWTMIPDSNATSSSSLEIPPQQQPQQQARWKPFVAGLLAGSISSGIMTPIDVLKTRLSTGTCPVHLGTCVQQIWHEQGWTGLYAGAGSRMMASGAFSAIGFGTFELAKKMLVTTTTTTTTTITTSSSPPKKKK